MQPALPPAGEGLAEVRCSFPREERQHQWAPEGTRGSRGLWFPFVYCLVDTRSSKPFSLTKGDVQQSLQSSEHYDGAVLESHVTNMGVGASDMNPPLICDV